MSDFERAFKRDNLLDAEDMGGGILRYSVEYVGGHPLYTDKRSGDLFLNQNDLFLKELNVHISYSSVKEATTVTQENISARAILAVGLVGVIFKENETFVRLVYNDGFMDQNLILRTRFANEIQKEIYQRIIAAKKQDK
jgi:hypothetical protein